MSDERDADNWFARVRRAATWTALDENGEWSPWWPMRDLYDEADALRAARPDDAWKEPFNRFRSAFTHRDAGALQRLASGLPA